MSTPQNRSAPGLSAPEIARVVELGEAEAYADMFEAAPRELGTRVERVGGAVALVARNVPVVLFNRVIGLGILEPVTPDVLTDIHGLYQGLPAYAVQIGPESRPINLSGWLESCDILPRDNWAKVYRPATNEIDVPTDLRVEKLGAAHFRAFAQVAATAFGMPPAIAPWLKAIAERPDWHVYGAFDGDDLVATGTMFARGNTAWLGIGGTLPGHRKRGAQGAIMARRIRDAAALGCDWVITETDEDTPERPNPSFHNMTRTGFRLAYHRRNYIFKA